MRQGAGVLKALKYTEEVTLQWAKENEALDKMHKI